MLTEREATNVPFLTERRVQAGDAGPAVGEFCAHPGCILPACPADCSFRLIKIGTGGLLFWLGRS